MSMVGGTSAAGQGPTGGALPAGLDGVSVLASCRDAEVVARALGLPLATGQPAYGNRYVVVVADADGIELATGGDERGYVVVAAVAWRLPAPLVARLASLTVPMAVGLPDAAALAAAVERGNTQQMRSTIARWVVIESYFARPGTRGSRIRALTAGSAA